LFGGVDAIKFWGVALLQLYTYDRISPIEGCPRGRVLLFRYMLFDNDGYETRPCRLYDNFVLKTIVQV